MQCELGVPKGVYTLMSTINICWHRPLLWALSYMHTYYIRTYLLAYFHTYERRCAKHFPNMAMIDGGVYANVNDQYLLAQTLTLGVVLRAYSFTYTYLLTYSHT